MMTSKELSNFLQNLAYPVKLSILLFFFTATVQAHQATITWDASMDPTAVGYRLHYGKTTGSYTSSIEVGSQTTYSVSNLQDGTYYFAVTSYNVNGIEGKFSNEASKTFTSTTPILPSPWLGMDIGNVGLAGNAGFTSGTFTLSGSGADILGTMDAFHFVYQPLNGNGTIIARIVSITNTHAFAKAGVMIRENLDSNARHATVLLTPNKNLIFQRRLSAGENSPSNSITAISTPYWVKLVRTGNNFSAYRSKNGINWVQIVSPVTINMAANVYIGLAVTSHNNNTLNTVKLDNVRVYSN